MVNKINGCIDKQYDNVDHTIKNADITKYISLIKQKPRDPNIIIGLKNDLNNPSITIDGKKFSPLQIMRNIKIDNCNQDLHFQIDNEEYTIKSGNNLIKLLQLITQFLGSNSVSHKNNSPLENQIDGKIGIETQRAFMSFQTNLLLKDEYLSDIHADVELQIINKNPGQNRKDERNNTIENNTNNGLVEVSSYGQESTINIDDGKVFFKYKNSTIQIPFDTHFIRDKASGLFIESEYNKEKIKKAVEFINVIHIIFNNYIKVGSKHEFDAKSSKPFYHGVSVDLFDKDKNILNQAIKFDNKNFTDILFDVTVLEKEFTHHKKWTQEAVNYNEFANFLNKLYVLEHPQKSPTVKSSTTTFTNSVGKGQSQPLNKSIK